jgi:flagellar basal body-associated protein FliL
VRVVAIVLIAVVVVVLLIAAVAGGPLLAMRNCAEADEPTTGSGRPPVSPMPVRIQPGHLCNSRR